MEKQKSMDLIITIKLEFKNKKNHLIFLLFGNLSSSFNSNLIHFSNY